MKTRDENMVSVVVSLFGGIFFFSFWWDLSIIRL